jgi:hypothetical protein
MHTREFALSRLRGAIHSYTVCFMCNDHDKHPTSSALCEEMLAAFQSHYPDAMCRRSKSRCSVVALKNGRLCAYITHQTERLKVEMFSPLEDQPWRAVAERAGIELHVRRASGRRGVMTRLYVFVEPTQVSGIVELLCLSASYREAV